MADNTIANAIKFLKGEEKSMPAAKTEGQVYFAYKNVGTAEKPSYTGAIYIDTPIGGTQNRIKMTANADIADKAFNDSAGLNIRDTYLSSLGYTDDGKQTILIKGSGNNQTRIALPIASTTKSGIVTTNAQSFNGTKTFTTINSTNLTVTGTSGFSYTGIETATGDKARPVWFAYDGINGKPVINTNFTYNPVTQTLSVANLSGTADKANKDNAGNDIRSTYISSVEADKDNKYKYNFKTPTGAIRNSITIYDEFQKRSQVDATTDWNTLTSTGIYKVQMSAWGDATKMHSPNGYNKDLYSFGILLVFESIANDGEKRFTQIYIPHNANISISGSAYKRMHNGSDITTDWQGWHPIARGLNWSELTGKPNYAGSSSAGGAATSANKLNTNAGSTTLPVYFSNGVPVVCSTSLGVSITGNAASATKLTSNAGSVIQPIYFSGGKPVACTYTINASVPSGAKFTDTWRPLGTTGDTACAGNDSRLSNARPASDVYAWAKASTKPSYSWGEITGKPSTFTPSSHTHSSLKAKIETIPTTFNTNKTLTYNFSNNNSDKYVYITMMSQSTYATQIRAWGPDIAVRMLSDKASNWDQIVTSSSLSSSSVKYATTAGKANSANLLNKNNSFLDSNVGSFSYYDADISNTTNNSSWSSPSSGWHQIYHNDLSVANYWTELAFPINDINGLAWRQRRNSEYFGWYRILDSNNYTSYTVTKDGSGASGTWGINVTGSAGSVAWGNISGKPSSFTPASHTHPYLPLSGGTMTGTINLTATKLACNFRPNSSAYCTGIMHQTNGNEALVFAAANAVTSFIFKCGQDPIGMTSSTWTGITPSMQIKKQSVYINSLIANNVTPAYNLYVNGTTRCNGTLGVGNGSSAEIDFFPNSASTIGARIKAYSDRIEFVFS